MSTIFIRTGSKIVYESWRGRVISKTQMLATGFRTIVWGSWTMRAVISKVLASIK
jgi:hypothetical protein